MNSRLPWWKVTKKKRDFSGRRRRNMKRAIRIGRYLKAVARTALGGVPAGRALTVFPNDLFLVSYFRSGSTWSQFLVGNLIQQETPITFANVERMVPLIYELPDRVLRNSPRILKSHECFDPRYPRVIYILRDPRDVAVSFYYYNLKVRVIADGYSMDEFVARFVAANVVSYADRVGCWQDHVLSWVRLRGGDPKFRLVRYEDLLTDPGKELANLAPLLGIEPTPGQIARAVRLSSVSHMKSLEKQQSKQWVTTKGTRENIPFVRQAKSGEWRNQLSARSIKVIEDAWGATMREFGYEQ